MAKEKQQPKVIGFKKYQEDTTFLSKRIDSLKTTVLAKSEAIARLQDTLDIEQKANDNLRKELVKVKENLKSLEYEKKNDKAVLGLKLEIIDEVSRELEKEKHKSDCFKLSIIGLEKQIEEFKKSKKKWYHFF